MSWEHCREGKPERKWYGHLMNVLVPRRISLCLNPRVAKKFRAGCEIAVSGQARCLEGREGPALASDVTGGSGTRCLDGRTSGFLNRKSTTRIS